MSVWSYHSATPPVKAHDVPDAFVALLVASTLFGTAPYLSSVDHIYAHEDPVDKPSDQMWITVRRFEPLGGQRAASEGEVLAQVQVNVVGPKAMANFHTWHRAMHDRCDQALLGKTPPGLQRATASIIARETEPSVPRYFPETDTRESFALYAVRLIPTIV